MKTKSWIYQYQTPAFGKVYYKKGVNAILIVYNRKVKLFKDITPPKTVPDRFYACYAKTVLTRRIDSPNIRRLKG